MVQLGKVAYIIMENNIPQKSNRRYKDTLFRTLFGESKRFLELYNAVANEQFPVDTVVTTYPPNDLLIRFNDLAACIGDQLVVFFEHQSTFSKNMPLRLLAYASDVLNTHVVKNADLYDRNQVEIPTPKFFVLYNRKEQLKEYELKLSDAFKANDSEPIMLELTAKIIDINADSGDLALSRSENLLGYSLLIDNIRKNISADMARDKAISLAIHSCIDQGILTEFLTDHYREVTKMLYWEYDADADRKSQVKYGERRGLEKGIKMGKKQGLQQGLKKGKKQGLQQGKKQALEHLTMLINDGMTVDEALEKVKSDTSHDEQ